MSTDEQEKERAAKIVAAAENMVAFWLTKNKRSYYIRYAADLIDAVQGPIFKEDQLVMMYDRDVETPSLRQYYHKDNNAELIHRYVDTEGTAWRYCRLPTEQELKKLFPDSIITPAVPAAPKL